jgi:hypothetical protein
MVIFFSLSLNLFSRSQWQMEALSILTIRGAGGGGVLKASQTAKKVCLLHLFNFTYFSSIAAPSSCTAGYKTHGQHMCVSSVHSYIYTLYLCTLRKMSRINAAFSGIVAGIQCVLYLMCTAKNSDKLYLCYVFISMWIVEE